MSESGDIVLLNTATNTILPNEIIDIIVRMVAVDNDAIAIFRMCCRKWVKLPYLKIDRYYGSHFDYYASHVKNTLYVSDGEWKIWKTKYCSSNADKEKQMITGINPSKYYYRLKVQNKNLGYTMTRILYHGYDSKDNEHYYTDINNWDCVVKMYRNVKRNNIRYVVRINHDDVSALIFRTNVGSDQLLNFDVRLKSKI